MSEHPNLPDDRMGLILYGLRMLVKDSERFFYGKSAERARAFVAKVDEKLSEDEGVKGED